MSLKKFEIQEMIAKGGMAEVYRAQTTGAQGFQKEVCVKKILPHLTEDENFVSMFVDEAKLAATLTYANIVQVHDLCVSASGEYFIVMEYVRGKDLSDVIRAAQLAGREVPPSVAVAVCREVCKGLHYAHTKTDSDGARLNIIHRDISPHNVLVSFMGEVKITDFGIAKASSIVNKTAVGILKGKYGYMSPEQARGQPLDARSDIFNTGIVLYELLVGERCFAGSSDFSTLNLMREAEVTPPSKIVGAIPSDLEAIVLGTLSKTKEDRPQDALQLEKQLGDWAKKHQQVESATDLASFMNELFSKVDPSRDDSSSTGVLALASVVGPPPSSPDEKAENKPAPRGPTPRDSKLAPAPEKSQVGAAALERAKRRATRARSRAEEPPAADIPKPEIQAKKPTTSDKPAKPRASKPLAQVPAPKKPSGAKKPVSAKKAPAEKPPEEKKERQHARVKKDAAPVKKKKAKKKAPVDKKPVGRRELRPGLTALNRQQRGFRGWGKAAAIVIIALGLGAGIGTWRGGKVQNEGTFRAMELATREGASEGRLLTILIDSEPRGATVRFDSRELSQKTPVAVERERNADAHQVELSKDGFRSATRSVKYDQGQLTKLVVALEGDPGRLEVSTQPSELSVRLNGEFLGETPLFREVPQGEHRLEIGGGDREMVEETIVITAGEKTRLSRRVPLKGSMAQLMISSQPRARVYLDGKATEHFSNGGPIPLLPDVNHTVGLAVEEEAPKEVVVKLGSGEKRRLVLQLGEERGG